MSTKLNINESFICRIWEGAGEYLTPLKTAEGDDVEIIDYGKKNFDSGPDYLNASVKIRGKIYNGHIEVHQDFKHWFEHKHPSDRKYVSVILQVVLWDSKNRKSPKLKIKRDIPTVILANHLKYSIHHIWQEIINKPSSKTKLPCANLNDSISDEALKDWFTELASERLKLKTLRINERLLELEKQSGGKSSPDYIKDKSHWEQAFYELVFEALGFSKNKEQMLKLARSYKLQDTRSRAEEAGSTRQESGGKRQSEVNKPKEREILLTIQAELFGISGLLFDLRAKDDYIEKVKNIWSKSESEIKAERLNKADWHFFRLRPQNFPTRRIAYGSQFIIKLVKEDLLKQIILLFQNNELGPKDIYRYLAMFLKPGKDDYWNKHYNFGKESAKAGHLLGAQRIDDIIVNVITPIVYLYADVFSKRSLKNRVIEFYTSLKTFPDNSIVKLVQSQVIKKREIRIDTPAMEQAAIHLYTFYCTRERCKECYIGKQVFKDTGYEYRIIYY